jgi:hypothetical protein
VIDVHCAAAMRREVRSIKAVTVQIGTLPKEYSSRPVKGADLPDPPDAAEQFR